MRRRIALNDTRIRVLPTVVPAPALARRTLGTGVGVGAGARVGVGVGAGVEAEGEAEVGVEVEIGAGAGGITEKATRRSRPILSWHPGSLRHLTPIQTSRRAHSSPVLLLWKISRRRGEYPHFPFSLSQIKFEKTSSCF